MHCQELWDSCAQNETSYISKMWLSGILGLPCAEQNVRNLKKCTFRNYGTPVRRTTRQKYQKSLSCFFGLRLAEQNVGYLKNVNFVLILNKVHILALNTAHVLRLNKADTLALNKAHVLRLNTKICLVFTANAKEAAFGRLHKGGAAFGRPPFVVSFVVAVSTGHILVLRRKTCALLRAKTCLVETQNMCCVES